MLSQTAATRVSQEEVRANIGKVLLAQEDLAFFSEYVSDGWYVAHAMHHLIAHELELVLRYLETDGRAGTQHLIILAPPQHGKSAMTSQFFPAFAFGKLPNLRITEISYGDALATKNSRAVRNLILSSKYQEIFGSRSPTEEQIILSKDSRSVSAWDLQAPNRGGMVAAGVGGAVAGQPKGLFIIDDPIKDHREAQSEAVRDDVWEFHSSVMRVRMVASVTIMTHWHPDDYVGRLFKQMVLKPDGDQYRVLDLPGLMERELFAPTREEQRKQMAEGVYMSLRDAMGRQPGEVLCPAMLSKAEMLKIKGGDEFYFAALYQQRPYLKEGQKYQREWFKKVSKIPDGVRIIHIVRFWDKANSASGDYTAGVLMAYCSDGYFYILDIVRIQATSHKRNQAMKKAAESDKKLYGSAVKIWHQQDPGSAGVDSAEATNKLLVGYPAKFETVSGSKEDRSDSLEDAFEGGLMFMLQGVWNEPYVEESCVFPRGKYDDQVDAASSAYNKLLEMIGQHRESRIL